MLAACVCGLYVSWNGPLLIPAATRLQGLFFWDLLIYVLEGALFLLTGLEARPLLERIVQVSGAELAVAALVTIVAVIAARFLWIYPAIYLPRWLVLSLRRNDPYPIWQRPFILSFTGVRGIVSLAAALALQLPPDATSHFEAAATKRGLSHDAMIHKLLLEVAADPNLLDNILDDGV